jgi:crotonobetainyl-CoA:carnitine CoA-transferase CaiB-like acyl-CoA transferase
MSSIGKMKLAWFVTLNASARKSSFVDSFSEKLLSTAASRLPKAGPLMLLRCSLPNCPALATPKGKYEQRRELDAKFAKLARFREVERATTRAKYCDHSTAPRDEPRCLGRDDNLAESGRKMWLQDVIRCMFGFYEFSRDQTLRAIHPSIPILRYLDASSE